MSEYVAPEDAVEAWEAATGIELDQDQFDYIADRFEGGGRRAVRQRDCAGLAGTRGRSV